MPATASPAAWWGVAAHPDSELDHELLCQAMAYGTGLASLINVEEFGVQRVARLTSDELAEQVGELQRITHFVERPKAYENEGV